MMNGYVIFSATTTEPLTTEPLVTDRPEFFTPILAPVITVIATALLATGIIVLVVIAVCKCHPKFSRTTAGGEEEQDPEYEEMDGDRGGVSDPTYMEIGEGGRNTFQLKENEAYSDSKTFQLKENEAYAIPTGN